MEPKINLFFKQIITIAKYTISESIEKKIILFAVAISSLTLVSGYFLTELMIGSRLKVLMDFSLLSYQIFEFFFICFFVLTFLNNRERLKMFSVFLVKPIKRSTFLSGVLVGNITILAIAGIFFLLASNIFIFLLLNIWTWHLTPAFIAILLESIFLTSSAILLSLLLPQILSYLGFFSIYIICYTSYNWLNIIIKKHDSIKSFIGYAIYLVLPDLSLLDIKNEVIYQLKFDLKIFLIAAIYTITSSFLLFILSVKIFNKKNL